MIAANQAQDALKTIQSLIVSARHQAYQAGAQTVGDLLDDIELLPEMLADDDDRSEEFRTALEGIAEKHPSCRYVLEEFLKQPVEDRG